jgi:hypothetical protein
MWEVKESREGRTAVQVDHWQRKVGTVGGGEEDGGGDDALADGEDAVKVGDGVGRPWTTSRCLRSVSEFCSSVGQSFHSQRKVGNCGLSLR